MSLAIDAEIVAGVPKNIGAPVFIWEDMAADPKTMPKIARHVAGGGDVVGWADAHGVPSADVWMWITTVQENLAQFLQATGSRDELIKSRIVTALSAMAFPNLASIYNTDGSMRPVHEWDRDAQISLCGIDTKEIFGDDERKGNGRLIRTKFVDKLKAMELLMKHFGMLSEKFEHTVTQVPPKKLVEEIEQMSTEKITDLLLGKK